MHHVPVEEEHRVLIMLTAYVPCTCMREGSAESLPLGSYHSQRLVVRGKHVDGRSISKPAGHLARIHAARTLLLWRDITLADGTGGRSQGFELGDNVLSNARLAIDMHTPQRPCCPIRTERIHANRAITDWGTRIGLRRCMVDLVGGLMTLVWRMVCTTVVTIR